MDALSPCGSTQPREATIFGCSLFIWGCGFFKLMTLILWIDTFASHMGVIGLIISLLFGVIMAALAIKSK